MSIIRSHSDRVFSTGDSMYVYPHTDGHITWGYGDPADPEDLCEVVCRIVAQAGVELDADDVDSIRDRLNLPPLDAVREQGDTAE